MSDSTCGTCRHSLASPEANGNLQCRRYPPAASPIWAFKQVVEQRIQLQADRRGGQMGGDAGLLPLQAGSIAVWPLVKPAECCGEFAPKLD